MFDQSKQLFDEKYADIFKELDLHIYTQTLQEDLLLFRWYLKLLETGDIERLIVPENRRLALFLQVFQLPAIAIYGLTPQGEIDFFCWFKDPSGSSIFSGVWASSELRSGNRRLLNIIYNVYSLAFEFYTTLLGATWQQDLLKLHLKFGYNIVGNLAQFMGQPTVWLVQLQRDTFFTSRLAKAFARNRR